MDLAIVRHLKRELRSTFTGPLLCIVSDMTVLRYQAIYYEQALYMDLCSNEILAYGLSPRLRDCRAYLEGLEKLIKLRSDNCSWEIGTNSDQGSVYTSEAYKHHLAMVRVSQYPIPSPELVRLPTRLPWRPLTAGSKEKLFSDFHLTDLETIELEIERYIKLFNEERPAYALGNMMQK